MKRQTDDSIYLDEPEPSLCVLDPYRRIMAGMVLQAINDLTNTDPLVCTDALCWLLTDDPAIWLGCSLGIEIDNETVFIKVIGGLINVRRSNVRFDLRVA